MKATSFSIQGPLLIEPKGFGDARGMFMERWTKRGFAELGINCEFTQDSFSKSEQNVLRGLHYQFNEPQSKLVTCVRGRVRDVIIDLRSKSPTFGKHLAVELDADHPSWLWIPAGFAHGFAVHSEAGADVWYKVDSYYNPNGEGGLAWNDPSLKIDWGVAEPILSFKDRDLPSFETYKSSPRF